MASLIRISVRSNSIKSPTELRNLYIQFRKVNLSMSHTNGAKVAPKTPFPVKKEVVIELGKSDLSSSLQVLYFYLQVFFIGDVWSIFSPNAGHVPKDSINLGQGFMNWSPPAFALKGVTDALEKVENHHYSLPRGRANLLKAISKEYSASFELGRDLDPNSEILVVPGATFGIYATFLTYLQPGDEGRVTSVPFLDCIDSRYTQKQLSSSSPTSTSMSPISPSMVVNLSTLHSDRRPIPARVKPPVTNGS